MNYTIELHRHRFGLWAASRAAGRGSFGNKDGAYLLECIDIKSFVENWPMKPSVLENFDDKHREWRREIISQANNRKIGKAGHNFTHGRAAKLINIYLKTTVICSLPFILEEFHSKIDIIHPPIDGILLSALSEHERRGLTNWNRSGCRWLKYHKIGWTKFNSQQYEGVVEEIRHFTRGNPLWSIESYWNSAK